MSGDRFNLVPHSEAHITITMIQLFIINFIHFHNKFLNFTLVEVDSIALSIIVVLIDHMISHYQ